jgi:hypothetical protein
VLLAPIAACAEDTPDETAPEPAAEESVAEEQPVAVTEQDAA